MIGFLAQNGSTSTGGGLTGLLVPLLLMGGLFYFMLIRPQRKQQQRHRALLASLQKGDQVVTSGGIIGKVAKVDDQELQVEIAEGESAESTQIRPS